MEDIYREVEAILERGEAGALATVVSRKGSAPMSSDAKMVVFQDGKMKGTVGGGCLEADVWAEAKNVIKRGTPAKMTFNLTEKEAGESGHVCGGIVDIYVEPVRNFERELLTEVRRVREEGGSAVLASIVGRTAGPPPGPKDRMLLHRDGRTLGSIEGFEEEVQREAMQVLRNEKPAHLTFPAKTGEGQVEIFLEPIVTRPTVYLFGGGHVSKYIAKVASVAGFRLVIVEDRPQYANKERFPEAGDFILVDDFKAIGDFMPPIEESDFLVMVTRGHQYDEDILGWAIGTPARYIGMIGSQVKILVTYRHLEEKLGIPRDEFIKRVRAPLGLEIGADSPGEIAVSIVAELIQVRRKSLIKNPELAGLQKSAALFKLAKG